MNKLEIAKSLIREEIMKSLSKEHVEDRVKQFGEIAQNKIIREAKKFPDTGFVAPRLFKQLKSGATLVDKLKKKAK